MSVNCSGLGYTDKLFKENLSNGDVCMYVKLFVLLYADDTVLLSDNPEDLQRSLNAMKEYCEMYKLSINESKTKIMIFQEEIYA